MDGTIVGFACIFVLLLCLVVGVPVGVALGIVGAAGMYVGLSDAFAFSQLRTLPFSVTSNYTFAVLPLFILMGIVAEKSGMSTVLFRAADIWLRPVKGGLYQVVIIGSAVFAAISGSTIVNALVFTRIAYPEMLRHGYSRSLSIGSIAASGGLAAMIPPSITMVIYAIMTDQSVGRMFMAGIIPGLMTAGAYVVGISVIVRIWPHLAPVVATSRPLKEKVSALTWVWPIALVFFIVIGGLYYGLFPPSGAGAAGAAGAILVALLYKKGVFRGWLTKSLSETVIVSCVIFVVLIGGLLFSRMLTVLGVVPALVGVMSSIEISQLEFMLAASLLLIALGAILDTTSMLVVTLPFLYPLSVQAGVDPIWFGIIVVKLIEISVITPPIGLNLFAVMSAVDKETNFGHVVRGVVPFLFIDIILLGVLIAFPSISLWLPSLM